MTLCCMYRCRQQRHAGTVHNEGSVPSPTCRSMFTPCFCASTPGFYPLQRIIIQCMCIIPRFLEHYARRVQILDLTCTSVDYTGLGLNYWGPTMNVARDPRWGRAQLSSFKQRNGYKTKQTQRQTYVRTTPAGVKWDLSLQSIISMTPPSDARCDPPGRFLCVFLV